MVFNGSWEELNKKLTIQKTASIIKFGLFLKKKKNNEKQKTQGLELQNIKIDISH